MGITVDNATSNDTFIDYLTNWMHELGISSIKNEIHFRCFAHILNLSVRKALQKLDNKIKQVCIANIYLYFYFYIINCYFYIVTRTYCQNSCITSTM